MSVDELKADLLHGLRVTLGPDQGLEAFERHQLLAIRFHRAARLNRPDLPGEGAGWREYFKEHFPRGDEHANLLWVEWRVPLLKDEYPGSGVLISHGQPHGHWQMIEPGGLFIDLESMWDDYEASINSLTGMLASEPDRCAATLDAWAKRQWHVQMVTLPVSQPMNTTASVAASATSMVIRPPRT